MDWLLAILGASWTMLVLAAPFILFGLLAAGLIHVLVPESLVLRFMGTPGLWGVVRAALIGVPLPVCSCGVVPITVELQRKGRHQLLVVADQHQRRYRRSPSTVRRSVQNRRSS